MKREEDKKGRDGGSEGGGRGGWKSGEGDNKDGESVGCGSGRSVGSGEDRRKNWESGLGVGG